MFVNSEAIVNEFIRLGSKEGIYFRHEALQMLVYFTNAINLVIGRKNINIDWEAWPFGPVDPILYSQLKGNGNSKITFFLDCDMYYQSMKKDWQLLDIIKNIYNTFKDSEESDIRKRTHNKGTPWSTVFDNKPQKITQSSIYKFYKGLLNGK